MSEGYMSDGALIQRENTPGGGVFTTIPAATTITPPKRVRKTADVFTHDQGTITKTGGREPMECVFTVAWDPANATHQALFTDEDAKTERNYKLILPDTGAATQSFAATVSSIEPGELGAEGTDALQLTVTLKLRGADTWGW